MGQWRKAEADIKADLETLQVCRDNFEQCPAPAAQLCVDHRRNQGTLGSRSIEAVNCLINSSVRYVSDLAQHGVLDRWTAPLATLAAGQGDCEDYAIANTWRCGRRVLRRPIYGFDWCAIGWPVTTRCSAFGTKAAG